MINALTPYIAPSPRRDLIAAIRARNIVNLETNKPNVEYYYPDFETINAKKSQYRHANNTNGAAEFAAHILGQDAGLLVHIEKALKAYQRRINLRPLVELQA